jgi:hypothetical protein
MADTIRTATIFAAGLLGVSVTGLQYVTGSPTVAAAVLLGTFLLVVGLRRAPLVTVGVTALATDVALAAAGHAVEAAVLGVWAGGALAFAGRKVVGDLLSVLAR